MNEWATYSLCRDTFCRAAVAAGGTEIERYIHPRWGPLAEVLSTDVYRFGNDTAEKTLLILSGTHGVEGHCGSLAQTSILRSRLLEDIDRDVNVFMVHAVNPYGFAWSRRVDSEGIDVNRNFVDFNKKSPSNDGFTADLADWLAPFHEKKATADVALMQWYASLGSTARDVIARGQYEFPHAPFYGGNSPSWSRRNIEEFMRHYLNKSSHLCVIDLHSGLGASGSHQMIGVSSASSPEIELGKAVWGNKYVGAGAHGSVSYDIAGDLIGAVHELLPKAQTLSAALEFGTLDELTVLEALRVDHGAHTHQKGPSRHVIARQMIQAFFPFAKDWADAVAEGAIAASRDALRWLGNVERA